MNRIKAWIRATLSFSRGESNAFLILLPLTILIIFALPIYRSLNKPSARDFTKHQLYLDSLTATWEWEQEQHDSSAEKVIHLFKFNPNTSSQQELESLGLKIFVAKRIVNYRTKGGKFFSKKDLARIYGMDSAWMKKAWPYIDLPDEKPKPAFAEKKTPEVKKKESAAFDLNSADTTQLITIYGIGSKLSLRIIKYRDKLGGFINMSQLKEVYGLDSAVITRLVEKTFIDRNFVPAKLNINQLTEKELASHPYLNWKIAKAITVYRFQHGAFRSVDDIAHVKLLDEPTLQRLKPYLTLD